MVSSTPAPLTAARQAQEPVGQKAALNRVKKVIYPQDRAFHLFFVQAQGGMGKTRLLEEIVNQVNGEWVNLGNTAVSNLIDVIDIRLHDRNRFIRELRDQYPQPGEFRAYERALDEVTLLRAAGAQIKEMQRAEEAAIDAFLKDLDRITEKRRVVWIIDTIEQLSYVTSKWLLKRDLLHAEDLKNRTHQWLIDLIKNKELENVTLIMAGRGQEGESFFASMESAYEEATTAHIVRKKGEIELEPLSRQETRDYFAQLARDWRNLNSDYTTAERIAERIAKQFELIASNENERADVLWLYTGGIPVRLALYAQIIVEGREIPGPLRYSYDEAVTKAETDNPHMITDALRRLQWDIEDKFINLLFRDPTDLHTRVLQQLVRAPRGLSAEQLHFVLDNEENQPTSQWRNDPRRLQRLTAILKEMMDLYLVKGRSQLSDLRPLYGEDKEAELEAATFRLGLQDEIYRIYAEHMAPHKDPVQDDIAIIWASLTENEQTRYRRNCRFEQQERAELYQKLSSWAEHQHGKYLADKQAYMARDERQLELQLVPDRPRTFYFEQIGMTEGARRVAITEAITTFEIEAMVYQILRDPERNINENYVDLGTKNQKANQGDFDFWAQAEMWRITHDTFSLKFVDFIEREQAREHNEIMVDVLHRAVAQEDVSRWIKRFVLRNDYKRALDLANRVEAEIEKLPKNTKKEQRIWRSWSHTLVYAERRIWACYARIYLSQETETTLKELARHIEKLEALLTKTVKETAVVRDDGHIERGFASVADKNIPAHPALTRVSRLLSLAYNILGYGYATVGQVRNAVENYGRSLYQIRGDEGMDSHRGYVLNDLSKALSDMGRTSIAVCLDGLNLRRKLAEEVPLAVSYNTLALIYDDMDRYDEAPELVAKAIAYLRRAGAQRWLGLALIQLGESLRHLAIRAQRGELAQATPDSLYSASEMLLREARTIFSDTEETYRLIIVLIEIGSLYRDRVRTQPHNQESHYREALVNLNEAIGLAQWKQLKHLQVDALINLAWTHFHMGRLDLVEEATTEVEKLVDKAYFIRPPSDPFAPGAKVQQPERDDENLVDLFWVMRQFSKLEMIRGQVALSRFNARAKKVGASIPDTKTRHAIVRKDETARKHLQNTARAYVLAFGYANILSRSGRMIDFLMDDLYDHLKAFAHWKLDDFHTFVLDLRKVYPELESIDILNRFLHEFFGIPKKQQELEEA